MQELNLHRPPTYSSASGAEHSHPSRTSSRCRLYLKGGLLAMCLPLCKITQARGRAGGRRLAHKRELEMTDPFVMTRGNLCPACNH
jgi:hypothetical protein